MSGRVTQGDLKRAALGVQAALRRLHWEQVSYDGSRRWTADDLELRNGSRTNGVQYRLVLTDGHGGHDYPSGLYGGGLGFTARDAILVLSGIEAGLTIAHRNERSAS
jgi:hypothetical protein